MMLASNRKKPLLKVVILGDGGIGKSCLMNRFISNKFDNYSLHTVGVEFSNKDVEINGQCFTLQIWDTAGQERFKSLRTPFYRGTDICILSYAVNDRKSFNNLSMWKSEFIFYSGIRETNNYPFLLVGTKVDLAIEKREVEDLEALTWCEENGQIPMIEASAKNDINVNKTFAMAVERWKTLEEYFDSSNNYLGNSVNLQTIPREKKSLKMDCCF